MASRPKPMSLISPKSVDVVTPDTSLPTKLDRTDSIDAPDVVKNAPKVMSLSQSTPLATIPKGNEADMQKVRDYQIKLNKKGANLVVDGVWGDKTAAASRDYYNKYQKNNKKNITYNKKENSEQGWKDMMGSDIEDAKREGKTALKRYEDTDWTSDETPALRERRKMAFSQRKDTTPQRNEIEYKQKPENKEFKSIPITLSNKSEVITPYNNSSDYFKERDKTKKMNLSTPESIIAAREKKIDEDVENTSELGKLGKSIKKGLLKGLARDNYDYEVASKKKYIPVFGNPRTKEEEEYKKKMKLQYKLK